ncbi:MAG: hypothetical protein FJX59_13690 [Alphaproteobacteria bacterium]|nr:hypothetical protein [Alphaproteobacteria bacterium]
MFDLMKRAFSADALLPRRALLAPSAGLALAASSSALAAPPDSFTPPRGRLESRVLPFADKSEKLKAEMRLYRELSDEADVLLWYTFTVFIVAEGYKAQAFVRYEGIEFSHHKKIGENLYWAHGHNASYPRDLATGAFVSSVINPVTKMMVEVPPTILTEDPGMLYSPEGKRPLNRKDGTFTPRYSFIRIEDDLVKCEEIRVPPDGWPQPFVETSHNWTAKALFDDPKVRRLPMGTSGGYVYPFPRWLGMGDIKGHMFGIWSGRKLDGVHQLPAEYFDRTQREHPDLLKVDLKAFEKPA